MIELIQHLLGICPDHCGLHAQIAMAISGALSGGLASFGWLRLGRRSRGQHEEVTK